MIKVQLLSGIGRARRRGYTLTELAIAMVVAAIVLGGVWVAATHVWDNYRISRASQQLTKITQNIREYYMNTAAFPAAWVIAPTDITIGSPSGIPGLDKLNLLPAEMRRTPSAGPGGSSIDHPLNNSIAGGSFHVMSVSCPTGGTGNCFRVRMEGLEQGPCIRLLMAVPVSDVDLGILAVGTQNAAILQDKANSTATAPSALTASTVAGWCNLTGATNEVDWDFKLHN